MFEYLQIGLFGDVLAVGAAGFVAGVLFPFGFRLIGYVIDSVRKSLRS